MTTELHYGYLLTLARKTLPAAVQQASTLPAKLRMISYLLCGPGNAQASLSASVNISLRYPDHNTRKPEGKTLELSKRRSARNPQEKTKDTEWHEENEPQRSENGTTIHTPQHVARNIEQHYP
jgi:hypothetical protein